MTGGKKRFWGAFALIFGGFCIPFATYYPAIMAYDVIPQLDQIRSGALTTHHPLIHTLLLKGCLVMGEALSFLPNADRAGLAMYSLLQMAVMDLCLSAKASGFPVGLLCLCPCRGCLPHAWAAGRLCHEGYHFCGACHGVYGFCL